MARQTPRKGLEIIGYVTDGKGLVLARRANSRLPQGASRLQSGPGGPQCPWTARHRPICQPDRRRGTGGLHPFVWPLDFLDGSVSPAWAVVYAVSTQAAFEPMERLSHLILVISAGATCYEHSRYVRRRGTITQPLRRLTAAAERIGAGDFSQPCEARTGDEIGILANEFQRTSWPLRWRKKRRNYRNILPNWSIQSREPNGRSETSNAGAGAIQQGT